MHDVVFLFHQIYLDLDLLDMPPAGRIPPRRLQSPLLLLAVEEATGQTGRQPDDLWYAERILEQDAPQDDADALPHVVANDDGGRGEVLVQGGSSEAQPTPKHTRKGDLSPDLPPLQKLTGGADLAADAATLPLPLGCSAAAPMRGRTRASASSACSPARRSSRSFPRRATARRASASRRTA